MILWGFYQCYHCSQSNRCDIYDYIRHQIHHNLISWPWTQNWTLWSSVEFCSPEMKCHADRASSITGETQNLEPKDCSSLCLDSSADKRRACFNHDIQWNAWGLRRVAWTYLRYSSQRLQSFDSVQQTDSYFDFFCGVHYYTSRWRVNHCFIHSKMKLFKHLLHVSLRIYFCLYWVWVLWIEKQQLYK